MDSLFSSIKSKGEGLIHIMLQDQIQATQLQKDKPHRSTSQDQDQIDIQGHISESQIEKKKSRSIHSYSTAAPPGDFKGFFQDLITFQPSNPTFSLGTAKGGLRSDQSADIMERPHQKSLHLIDEDYPPTTNTMQHKGIVDGGSIDNAYQTTVTSDSPSLIDIPMPLGSDHTRSIITYDGPKSEPAIPDLTPMPPPGCSHKEEKKRHEDDKRRSPYPSEENQETRVTAPSSRPVSLTAATASAHPEMRDHKDKSDLIEKLKEVCHDNDELYKEGTKLQRRVVDLERRMRDKIELQHDLETKITEIEAERDAIKAAYEEASSHTAAEVFRMEMGKVKDEHERQLRVLHNSLEAIRANSSLSSTMDLESKLETSSRRVAILESELDFLRLQHDHVDSDTNHPLILNDMNEETRSSYRSNQSNNDNNDKISIDVDQDEEKELLMIGDVESELVCIRQQLIIEKETNAKLNRRIEEINDRHSVLAGVSKSENEETRRELEILKERFKSCSREQSAITPSTNTPHQDQSKNPPPPSFSPPPTARRELSEMHDVSELTVPESHAGTEMTGQSAETRVSHVPRLNILLAMRNTESSHETSYLSASKMNNRPFPKHAIDSLDKTQLIGLIEAERDQFSKELNTLKEQYRSAQRMVDYLHELLLNGRIDKA